MGLDPIHTVTSRGPAPCVVLPPPLQALECLGRALLFAGDAPCAGASSGALALAGPGTGDELLPAEVLVSAARQHLMSAPVGSMLLEQATLMVADLAALEALHCAHQLAERCAGPARFGAQRGSGPGRTPG